MTGSGDRRAEWELPRLIAGLIAVAFLFQSFALFAQGARQSPSASFLRLAAHAQHSSDCPQYRDDGSRRHESGGCPMCQALGCATPGTPVVDLVATPGERLIGLLSIDAAATKPPTPTYERAQPRGPPAIA